MRHLSGIHPHIFAYRPPRCRPLGNASGRCWFGTCTIRGRTVGCCWYVAPNCGRLPVRGQSGNCGLSPDCGWSVSSGCPPSPTPPISNHNLYLISIAISAPISAPISARLLESEEFSKNRRCFGNNSTDSEHSVDSSQETRSNDPIKAANRLGPDLAQESNASRSG